MKLFMPRPSLVVNVEQRAFRLLKTGRCRRRLSISSSFAQWKVDPATGIVSRDNGESVFQTIIGLEIHAQLQIPTKLFSPATLAGPHTPPNTHLSMFDVAVPGSLPVLSKSAVQAAVLSAAVLNCRLPQTSRFERKHYAYADLPAGYQITQQRWPLAVDGWIQGSIVTSKQIKKKKKMEPPPLEPFRCKINRVQLEQDTAKTTSHTTADSKSTFSRVDFNRAGSALIEIVTEPDLQSSQQAVAAVETVRQLLKHVGTCDGRLQEGSLRVDLNINLSLLEDNDSKSARVEVKNLNSLRQVQDAAEYEARRQAAEWETSPGKSETRTWSVPKKATTLIRRKDDEQDYRFLPEPDLPPLVLNHKVLDGLSLSQFIDKHMPELPSQSFQRLIHEYGLSEYQAGVITSDPPAIRVLDTAVQAALKLLNEDDIVSSSLPTKDLAQAATKLLSNELFALVKDDAEDDQEASIQSSPVTGVQLGEIVFLLLKQTISSTMAKTLLAALYHEEEPGASARSVAKARGLELISDPAVLQDLCRKVVDEHRDQLEQYKSGGKYITKIFKFLTGKAMEKSRGNAHPERLREALQGVLDDVAPISSDEL